MLGGAILPVFLGWQNVIIYHLSENKTFLIGYCNLKEASLVNQHPKVVLNEAEQSQIKSRKPFQVYCGLVIPLLGEIFKNLL